MSELIREIKGTRVIIRQFIDKKGKTYFTKQIGKKKKGRISKKKATYSVRSIKAYETRRKPKKPPITKPPITKPPRIKAYKYVTIEVGRSIVTFQFPIRTSNSEAVRRAINSLKGGYITKRNVKKVLDGEITIGEATDNQVYGLEVTNIPPERFDWAYKFEPKMKNPKRIQIQIGRKKYWRR